MSYDVYIGDFSANYTFNVSNLFYDHIEDMGNGGGLNEIDNKTGSEVAGILAKAFDRIYETKNSMWSHDEIGERAFCAKYDAPNGWGSAVGGIVFLARIMAAAASNPEEIMRVC